MAPVEHWLDKSWGLAEVGDDVASGRCSLKNQPKLHLLLSLCFLSQLAVMCSRNDACCCSFVDSTFVAVSVHVVGAVAVSRQHFILLLFLLLHLINPILIHHFIFFLISFLPLSFSLLLGS
jgi:hypothetical protein